MKKYISIEAQLVFHEGVKLKPYPDSLGKITIGVGRNLTDNGISEDEAMMMFGRDLKMAVNDLTSFFGKPFWDGLLEGRRRALTDLRYNIGPNRFRGFVKMIAAVQTGNWDTAAEELKDSRWWSQVQPDRRETLFEQLKTGNV